MPRKHIFKIILSFQERRFLRFRILRDYKGTGFFKTFDILTFSKIKNCGQKQKKPPGEVLSGRQDMNLKNGTRFLFLRVILQEPSQPRERPRQEQAALSLFPRQSRPLMSHGLPSPQGTVRRPSRKSRTARLSFQQAGLQSS